MDQVVHAPFLTVQVFVQDKCGKCPTYQITDKKLPDRFLNCWILYFDQ